MDVIGVMFSVSVDALRMPRFLPNTAIYMSKLDQKLASSEWHCYPVLVNNSWGIYQISYEPITGVDRFNVLSMKECSSADWNLMDTNIWVNLIIVLKEYNRMSQHCPFIISNSKQ